MDALNLSLIDGHLWSFAHQDRSITQLPKAVQAFGMVWNHYTAGQAELYSRKHDYIDVLTEDELKIAPSEQD